ncbi:uncharacterized protein BDR25DRAFT_366447 [Lindgomyces ingoldianus]|uniref:Uncharacterized protein n=1 Tax=Lindgomyces ingoldianus TaxID=673940 RepID=A0ACB6R067_9PLEO|nr:uncharacterized protein BDR25DRAFT_366447 [Lindgomyces ingoldianus]KAF2472427.1 hypothetical protein BDR25DRAFT_366447 [Lindgomyces ingoldianus]
MNGSRQLNAYVCLFVTFTAATICLALRLIARRITKLRLWFDDYLAIIAFICAGVWSGLVLWWLQIGLGRYLKDIDSPDFLVLERSRLILWNVELFYAFSLAFTKLAILAFYWRMFKTSKIKIPIQVLAGCAILWLVLRKFWRPELEGVCNIDDSKFFFGTVLTHLILDIAILALPVIEVQKLHLPLGQRLGIMGMFMFGIFVCVASIVVLVDSLQYDTSSIEVPWNISPIIIWATVEVNLAIVSACLPMLRPIYFVVTRRGPISKNNSSHLSYPSSFPNGRSVPSAHKLATITVSKNNDFDETGSTHQLAGARGGSISSTSSNGGDGDRHGMQTIIVGRATSDKREERSRWNGGMGGIMVTNEMSVSVSTIR